MKNPADATAYMAALRDAIVEWETEHDKHHSPKLNGEMSKAFDDAFEKAKIRKRPRRR